MIQRKKQEPIQGEKEETFFLYDFDKDIQLK